MTFAAIANVTAGSTDSGNTVTSGAINTTGADLIVVVVGSANDKATANDQLTDSQGNTWNKRSLTNSTLRTQVFDCLSPTTSASHTFTFQNTLGAVFPTISVSAWSGGRLAGSFDQESGAANFGASTVDCGGGFTPSESNELLVTGIAESDLIGFSSISGGFTLLSHVGLSSGQHYGAGSCYLIQTIAAAANPTWTMSGSFSGGTRLVSYKAQAAAPSTALPFITVLGAKRI